MSPAACGRDVTPLLVGFDVTTVIDLVGHTGHAVANYTGPNCYADLDTFLGKLLSDADPNLRQALTLDVLARAQEMVRFWSNRHGGHQ